MKVRTVSSHPELYRIDLESYKKRLYVRVENIVGCNPRLRIPGLVPKHLRSVFGRAHFRYPVESGKPHAGDSHGVILISSSLQPMGEVQL